MNSRANAHWRTEFGAVVDTQTTLTLMAPLTGVVVPIETVPDPVFAKKMVGEGVSIDPLSNQLLSPCDGEVATVHASKHAVTVRHASGAEILMHIGLDTVSMQGDGFTALAKVGDQVRVGDPLVEFDLDMVANKAKSVLTQIVITNTDQLAGFEAVSGLVEAGKDDLASLIITEATDDDEQAIGRTVVSNGIVVLNPLGLHARPTATLVGIAKKFDAKIRIKRGDDQANAKSVIAILTMEVLHGDKVQVLANGSDAAEAVAELEQAIIDGLGEEVSDQPAEAAPAAAVEAAPEPKGPLSGDPNLLLGVSASPGLGIGNVVQLKRDEIQVTEDASDKYAERRRLNSALDRAAVELQTLQSKLEADGSPDKAAIFVAHAELLADPDLLDIATSAIDKGKSAEFAWQQAYRTFADQLAGLGNPLLAERAIDVRDVGQRVLEELTGQKSEQEKMPEGTILIAEDLTPSDTANLDPTRVAGFATTSGGATSHVAILARSLDIPAVAGIEARALDVPEGMRVILDGTKGTLRVGVSDAEVEVIRVRQAKIAERRAAENARAHEPAVTSDGHKIDVMANVGSPKDIQDAVDRGAEGVGLLRSEFLFLGRSSAPTEEEQAEIYIEMANQIPGKPLVIRTLDVGGDKPLPYLPMAPEENPFLGLRGVRIGLDRPEILRTQARAILKAVDAGAALHVMFPMIATMSDFRRAKEIFEEERAKLGVSQVPLGVMVEVPSVAVMAEQFAREVDFFSVGTNDLTQYTLAMDRGHPMLAPQVDALNPAVLGLIHTAAKAAYKYDRWIGVCGGVASDPQAVPLLIGLGVGELSCSIPSIPSVKAQVRAYSFDQCQDLAASALRRTTAGEVRDLVPLDED